jgi:CubicO group peptidase (beta-lactamase class C family)
MLDQFVTEQLSRYQLPGIALAAARGHDLFYEYYAGRADFEVAATIEANTVFDICSIAKQFCAAAILLLVEENQIRVTDKVAAYIDDGKRTWDAIEIRHLLSNTSGIKNYYTLPEEDWPTIDTVQECIQLVNRLPLEFQPGDGWSYSNTGYMMLASIVERVSGLAYETFLQERFFKPLAMSATKVNDPLDNTVGNAKGYVLESDIWQEYQRSSLSKGPPGTCCTLSSISDLLRWSTALRDGQLLEKTKLAEMWQPTLLNDGRTARTIFLESTYGYGWCIGELDGVKAYWTPGTGSGFTSILMYLPEQSLTVVGLCNGSRMPDFNWFNRFALRLVELLIK